MPHPLAPRSSHPRRTARHRGDRARTASTPILRPTRRNGDTSIKVCRNPLGSRAPGPPSDPGAW
jgi:hypothetical protein